MKTQRLNPGQMSIYMNQVDRWRVDRLLTTMVEEGDPKLLDKKQEPSTSALFRRLVREEMQRRDMDIQPPSENDDV